MKHRVRFCIHLLSLGLSQTACAQIRDGFLRYPWGTDLDTLKRYLTLERVADEGRRQQYSVNIDTLSDIPLLSCDFEFTRGKLSGVIIMTDDSSSSHRLFRWLGHRYGEGHLDDPLGWQWFTRETHVRFDEGGDGRGYLYLYSLRTSDQ